MPTHTIGHDEETELLVGRIEHASALRGKQVILVWLMFALDARICACSDHQAQPSAARIAHSIREGYGFLFILLPILRETKVDRWLVGYPVLRSRLSI